MKSVEQLRVLLDKHYPGWIWAKWYWGHEYKGGLIVTLEELIVLGEYDGGAIPTFHDDFEQEFYESVDYVELAVAGITELTNA